MGEPRDDEPTEGSSHTAAGFPAFEHNQWTVEGEIERFGAFGQGVARARGWKRLVGLFLVVLIVLPILLGATSVVVRALS